MVSVRSFRSQFKVKLDHKCVLRPVSLAVGDGKGGVAAGASFMKNEDAEESRRWYW